MAVPLTAAAMVTAATMRNRPAPTDITITILTLARRTDITGQTGSITASSLGSVPGTVGAGAAVADTGATIGADVATVIAVDMDIAAATDTAADTVITVDMDAAGMDTMAATAVDIMVAGLTPVADTTAVAADTMAVAVGSTAVVVADTTVAAVEDSTVAVAADSTVAVAVDSTAAAVDMAADTDSRQVI